MVFVLCVNGFVLYVVDGGEGADEWMGVNTDQTTYPSVI